MENQNQYNWFTGKNEKNSLVIFFILSYLISWGLYYLQSLIDTDLELYMSSIDHSIGLLETLVKFGPSIAGVIMAIWVMRGKNSQIFLREMVRKLLYVDHRWTLFAFLLAFVLNFGAVVLNGVLTGESLVVSLSGVIFSGLFTWLALRIFLGGGFGEEFGFRAFALPRMQFRFGTRRASLYLGIIWSLWHLPANLEADDVILQIIVQFVFTVSLAFLFTYVYNASNGNLLAAILLHGGLNGFNAFFEQTLYPQLDESSWIIFYILLSLVAAIISTFAMGKFSKTHLIDTMSETAKSNLSEINLSQD